MTRTRCELTPQYTESLTLSMYIMDLNQINKNLYENKDNVEEVVVSPNKKPTFLLFYNNLNRKRQYIHKED